MTLLLSLQTTDERYIVLQIEYYPWRCMCEKNEENPSNDRGVRERHIYSVQQRKKDTLRLQLIAGAKFSNFALRVFGIY